MIKLLMWSRTTVESCEISMNQHGACIVRVNFCDGTES